MQLYGFLHSNTQIKKYLLGGRTGIPQLCSENKQRKTAKFGKPQTHFDSLARWRQRLL